jgi:hypothetical protein
MTDEKYLEGVLLELYWSAFNDFPDYQNAKNDYTAQAKVAKAEARRFAKRIVKRMATKANRER